ncbi:hypothetical protein CHARACLAT_023198 [Characodon lateralis]|uniref:Uncharacterized protein n=1 Tax=Characodon lateralis TaxID=208331 RepID=A0ABU7E2S1_9TELE|nr:hypothetical protein [Characodon lateralis]
MYNSLSAEKPGIHISRHIPSILGVMTRCGRAELLQGPTMHIMSVYPHQIGLFPSHMKYKTGRSREQLFSSTLKRRLTRSSSEIHMIKCSCWRCAPPQKSIIHMHAPPVFSTACSA